MMSEVTLEGYINRVQFFQDACKDRSVLHLGCSSGRYLQARMKRGSLLHSSLHHAARTLYGLDLDGHSLIIMKEQLGFDHLYQGNAETLDEVQFDRQFDIVLAGDLLEHITCPGAMLNGIQPLLKPDGKVIISTNNAFGLHYQLRRWAGTYTEHFEHVCFYSPETLLHLFTRHGFGNITMYGAFTEPPYTFLQKIQFVIGSPLFRLFPVLAGTLIVVAQR